MAFDVQTLNELAKCGDCLSPNQKQNVLLYLLNGILENGTGGGGLHNFLSLTHPDTVPGPPTRGALVVGNATPDWESLPIGAANRVLRSDGVDATWSQLVLTADVTGILPIANGGTNSSAALNNNRIMVSSGGAIVEAAALTDGQLLIGSTGAAPVVASLTAGANITITPGAGSITIASTIGTHTILDAAVHTDSVTQTVSRGSLIYGNSTPKWDELTIGAAGRFLGSDGTDVSWTVLPGSFTGFANPTASVGLVVVNGVATTAMRSDAAPPLSQAIAPTWTGPHIFSPIAALAIQLNPFGAAAGNTSELRFLELAASGTNYTGFKAADAMAASEIYVLPDAAPSANRFLRAGAVAAGVSTLSWAQISLTADVTGILPVANGGTGTSTAFTQGSVIFAGAAGVFTQDNANLFFDNANNRLGVATAVPLYTLHVFGPGSLQYGFAAGALILGADLNATTISVNTRKIGRVNMVSYDGGATNTFLFGGDFQAGGNDIYFGGVTAGSQYAATTIHFFTGATQTTTGGTERMTLDNAGNVGIGIAIPLASLHIVPLTAPALLISPFGAAAGNTGEFRLRELTANGTNYTGFKAADAMAASEIYVLPNAAPAANRFLQAAAVAGGVSALSWAQVSLTADVTGILPVANGGSGTSTAFTQGSVIFAGVAGVFSQDNANLFYDDALNRLTVNQLNVSVVTSATVGGIYFGASLAIHNFTANSIFVGTNCGNLTMTGTTNTVMGVGAGIAITTAAQNVIIGRSAGAALTEGTQNSFLGRSAGLSCTTGSNNAFFGRDSGQQVTTGSNNLCFGFQTGDNITTGSFNLVIGQNIDAPSTTGDNTLTIGNLIFGTGLDAVNASLASGNVGIGVITPLAKFHVVNSAAATVATIIKAAAAQSANLTEWQSSAAVVLACVDEVGKVGIGTSAPAYSLDVRNNADSPIAFGSTAAPVGFFTYGPVVVGDTSDAILKGSAGSGVAFQVDNAALTPLVINKIGDVGIGTNSPLARLHVTNSAAATVGCIIKAAAAQSANLTEWQDSSAVILSKVNSAGNVGVRMAATAITAYLHIAAGTTAASTAPIKLTTGTSMTAAEAGAMEFTTDDLFFTITTGAARKRLLMADATAGLTATRVPFATTNGRLTDDATMMFAAATLTVPALTIGAAGVLQLGNAAVAETPTPTHTVTLKDSTGTTYRVPVVV